MDGVEVFLLFASTTFLDVQLREGRRDRQIRVELNIPTRLGSARLSLLPFCRKRSSVFQVIILELS